MQPGIDQLVDELQINGFAVLDDLIPMDTIDRIYARCRPDDGPGRGMELDDVEGGGVNGPGTGDAEAAVQDLPAVRDAVLRSRHHREPAGAGAARTGVGDRRHRDPGIFLELSCAWHRVPKLAPRRDAARRQPHPAGLSRPQSELPPRRHERGERQHRAHPLYASLLHCPAAPRPPAPKGPSH